MLRGVVPEEVHAEVRRNRVEAAEVDDAGPCFHGTGVVFVDRFANERNLSRDVAVVRAMTGTRGGELSSVTRVRADGSADYMRLRGEQVERRLVIAVGNEDGQPGETSVDGEQTVAHAFQLSAVPTGDGPAQVLRGVCREVRGYQLSVNPVVPKRTMS